MKRAIIPAIGMTLGLGAACSMESTPRYEQKAVYGNTFQENNSTWSVECFEPTRSVEAKSGDILLRLVLNNTDLIQPANLGKHDVPQQVYLEAIADMNDLSSPDEIIAGNSYELPDRCQPTLTK